MASSKNTMPDPLRSECRKLCLYTSPSCREFTPPRFIGSPARSSYEVFLEHHVQHQQRDDGVDETDDRAEPEPAAQHHRKHEGGDGRRRNTDQRCDVAEHAADELFELEV